MRARAISRAHRPLRLPRQREGRGASRWPPCCVAMDRRAVAPRRRAPIRTKVGRWKIRTGPAACSAPRRSNAHSKTPSPTPVWTAWLRDERGQGRRGLGGPEAMRNALPRHRLTRIGRVRFATAASLLAGRPARTARSSAFEETRPPSIRPIPTDRTPTSRTRRQSLELAREIAQRSAQGDPDAVDPRLSPAQRAAAEVALGREQRATRRTDRPPWPILEEDLRRISSATTFDDACDRPRSGAPDARSDRAWLASRSDAPGRRPATAYAPGRCRYVARYYFAEHRRSTPLVREEDTNGRRNAGSLDRVPQRRAQRDLRGRPGPRSSRTSISSSPTADRAAGARRDRSDQGDGRAGARLPLSRTGSPAGRRERHRRRRPLDRIRPHRRRRTASTCASEDLDGDGAIDVRSVFRAEASSCGGRSPDTRVPVRSRSTEALTPGTPAGT